VNDWERIKDALFANPRVRKETLDQAWRWTASGRKWLDEVGLDARDVDRNDIARFVEEVPPGDGVQDANKRKWAFKLLAAAAKEVAPPIARSPHTATAQIDRVPARSPLGKVITRVLATANTKRDREVWPTCLGAFLLWCGTREIDPMKDLWPGHIDAYRRDYLANKGTSPGEYVRVARRLLAEIRVYENS
jgi:hypothetical protein